MPSVADELAALRAGGGVKARAADFDNGASISTPEAEEAAKKSTREQEKLSKANARENLSKWGNGANSAELEHSLQQIAQKKADKEKVNEAKKSLRNSAYTANGGKDKYTSVTATQVQTEKKKSDNVVTSNDSVAKVEAPELEKVNGANKSSKVTTHMKAANGGQETSTSPDVAAPQAPKENETDNDLVDDASIEEVNDVEEVDDDVPDLEEAADIPELDEDMKIQQTTADSESRQVTNRNEKKARKMMQRLGMNPVSGIERATFKTGGQGGYFFIDNPDVYQIDKTYVIFGEARQGGNMQQQQAAMAQAQAQAAMAAQQQQQSAATMPSVAEEGVEVEVEENVDEAGVDEKDINLVMSQASCSRAKAVKALKENDNDLVNAIMSLTL